MIEDFMFVTFIDKSNEYYTLPDVLRIKRIRQRQIHSNKKEFDLELDDGYTLSLSSGMEMTTKKLFSLVYMMKNGRFPFFTIKDFLESHAKTYGLTPFENRMNDEIVTLEEVAEYIGEEDAYFRATITYKVKTGEVSVDYKKSEDFDEHARKEILDPEVSMRIIDDTELNNAVLGEIMSQYFEALENINL